MDHVHRTVPTLSMIVVLTVSAVMLQRYLDALVLTSIAGLNVWASRGHT